MLRRPSPDTSQETSPLLTAYCDRFPVASESENTGGSAVDDGTVALHRNEQDGKNITHKSSLHVPSEYSIAGDNSETYASDNVPKDKRQLGQVTTWFCGIKTK